MFFGSSHYPVTVHKSARPLPVVPLATHGLLGIHQERIVRRTEVDRTSVNPESVALRIGAEHLALPRPADG